MDVRKSVPNLSQLSIISAAIMLAFALTRLITFPAQTITFTVFGVGLDFILDFNTIITLLTVILAAAGMDWLIQSHPHKDDYQTHWAYIRHWIVPILTTLVIGIALNTFSGEVVWWVIYGLGSLLLIAVLVSEYNIIAVSHDLSHPLAAIGLTGLSFALFLLLSITIYAAELRLVFRLPILSISAMMVVSRTFYLRSGKWQLIWALVISMLLGQLVIGFQYLPLNPTQASVILVGVTYGLTSIVMGVKESRDRWSFWTEPVIMLALMVLISLLW